jgi:hypothetical protein
MSLVMAESAAPTGGANASEIFIAGGIAALYFSVTGWVIVRERLGHTTLVGRGANALSAKVGLPAWAVLPALGLFPVWVLAGFGVYWDVPIHMQKGRDEGPLANPSHYPIFLVLLFLCCFGLLIMALAKDPLPKRTLRLAPGWNVPFSSVILTLSGVIAVIGFPADDLWHRIFGQDVTEWGPTHVLMIGGAICSPFCLPLLLAEARQVGARLLAGRAGRWIFGFAFSFCMLPMAFLMEFELGLPQFPAATEFIIFGFLMTWTAIATRIWFGRGGALYAGFWWLLVHGVLVAVIAPLPDILTIRFMTAVPTVVIIELVALAFGVTRGGGKNLLPFAVVAGLLSGALGLTAEFFWANEFMPIAFNTSAAPMLVAAGTVASVAAALFALWHVRRTADVAGEEHLTAVGFTITPTFTRFGLAGFALFLATFGTFYQPAMGDPLSAKVAFETTTDGMTTCSGDEVRCEAHVTLTIDDPERAEDAVWLTGFAWQGWQKGLDVDDIPRDPIQGVPGIIRTDMVPTGTPGQYRTADPMPLYGEWKSMVRIHEAPRTMMTFVLHMPDDPSITSDRGRLIHAVDGDTIEARYEPKMLQRERKDGVPDWLYNVANYSVLGMWVGVMLLYGACYNRAAGFGRRKGDDYEKVDA